jgi:hypothetical protein
MYQNFGGKYIGKRPLGKPKGRWNYDRCVLRELGYDDRNLMELTEGA